MLALKSEPDGNVVNITAAMEKKKRGSLSATFITNLHIYSVFSCTEERNQMSSDRGVLSTFPQIEFLRCSDCALMLRCIDCGALGHRFSTAKTLLYHL